MCVWDTAHYLACCTLEHTVALIKKPMFPRCAVSLSYLFIFQIVSSLKRIAQSGGLVEPKYTARHSVESKVGSVHGWEELLASTGFHFISQMKKDVPATIVFPEHDDSGLQRRAQKYIEALLGKWQSFAHDVIAM